MEKIDPRRIRSEYRIVAGCILGQGELGFAALDIEAERDEFFVCQTLFWLHGIWHAGPYFAAEAVAAAAGLRTPLDLIIAGREGDVYEVSRDGYRIHEPLQYEHPGPLRRARKLREKLLITCEERGVLEYDGREWRRLAAGLPEEPDGTTYEDEMALLDRAIEETELSYGIIDTSDGGYCMTATGGEIWVWQEGRWVRDQAPTNVNLYDITRTTADRYVISGQLGILLHGSPGTWQIVPTGVESDLLSIATFKNRIFAATGLDLLTFAGQDLVPVDFGTGGPIPAHQVTAADHSIVSIAGQEVMLSLDGERWASLL